MQLFQVTFVSSEPIPPEFSHSVEFGNFTYILYSHSLLQFGQVTFAYQRFCSFGGIDLLNS